MRPHEKTAPHRTDRTLGHSPKALTLVTVFDCHTQKKKPVRWAGQFSTTCVFHMRKSSLVGLGTRPRTPGYRWHRGATAWVPSAPCRPPWPRPRPLGTSVVVTTPERARTHRAGPPCVLGSTTAGDLTSKHRATSSPRGHPQSRRGEAPSAAVLGRREDR